MLFALFFSHRSSRLYQSAPITGHTKTVRCRTRNLPSWRFSTSHFKLDQVTDAFSCWKNWSKGRQPHHQERESFWQRVVPMRGNKQHGNKEGNNELECAKNRFVKCLENTLNLTIFLLGVLEHSKLKDKSSISHRKLQLKSIIWVGIIYVFPLVQHKK